MTTPPEGAAIRLGHLPSPIGDLHVALLDGAICFIGFDTADWRAAMERYLRRAWKRISITEAPLPKAVQTDITSCFRSSRHVMQTELVFHGTPFQEAVWKVLLDIPRGSTWTYGEVAERIGRPRAVRAVGTAIGSNPIPVIIPCHRVIGRDGSLTGFGGGLGRKRTLLELEGAAFTG